MLELDNQNGVCPLGTIPAPNAMMGWKCHVVWSTPQWEDDSYLLLLRRPHDHFPNNEEWCVARWKVDLGNRGWQSAAYAMGQEEALKHGDEKCAMSGGGQRWVATGPVDAPHWIYTWRIYKEC